VLRIDSAAMAAVSPRTREARALFAPLGPTYDRFARLLSLGQDPRWRRFLVDRLGVGPDEVVLDVATGTGAVAIELVQRKGCAVVGIDQSPEMLDVARRRLVRAAAATRVRLVEARAEELPFEDGSFDGLTVTYLLRYVDDPAATLVELARVVRPGGTIASLEFSVPPAAATRLLWELYTGVGLPLAGRPIGGGWLEVGRFLRTSIRSFYERLPLERQLALWREAGVEDVRFRRLSLGGGIVIWGRRG
jgi:demethylmenaquinone methyltransferase/2-methoxy-6-polyprenyl-1,4-benzoquinol methylase